MSDTLAERLQSLRRTRGMSQDAMAKRLVVKRQVISEWECGISVPRTRDIPMIARVLGCTTDYLLTGREAPAHAALIAAVRAAGTRDARLLALVEGR